MADRNRVVAIGLLTARDLEVLGTGFKRVFPLDASPTFGDLLRAIDEAEGAWLRMAPNDQQGSGVERRPTAG